MGSIKVGARKFHLFFFVWIDIWEKKARPPKKVTSPKTNDSKTKVRKFRILNPKMEEMEVGGR